jgi:hypothetical protein
VLKFAVCLEGTIVAKSDVDVERHLDQVMAELLEIGADDPSIDVDLGAQRVDLAVAVDAANPLDAANTASALIRTAIHAAGGATPDWPAADVGAWAIRLMAVRSGELIQATHPA